jgi:Flp pilus assembly protein TadD
VPTRYLARVQAGRDVASASRREWLVLGAILLVTTLVYARGLAGELVYDDHLLIERNPEITELAALPRLFTRGYWDFLGLRDAQYIGYWRPLSAVVHALVWPFSGSRPLGHHLASLTFHLLAVVAAHRLARRLGASPWIAAGAALLFALHPAQVESVAWISAVGTPLSGALVLLALERFLAWRARGLRGVPLVAAIAFGLALLAKELAATFLPLAVLLDLVRPRAPDEPRRHALLRAYAPFALVALTYLAARMFVFASPYAGLERVTTDFVVGAARLLVLRLELLGGGLEILALPLELNLFRPFRPHLAALDPALVRAAVFTALYLALVVATLRARRRLAAAALLAIPLGFLPVLVQVHSLGSFPLSERFLYLPAFGFALASTLFFAHAFPRRAAGVLTCALALAYGLRSHARIGTWHDGETLLGDAAARSPRALTLQWIYGRELLERYSATREPRHLLEAQRVFEHAVALLDEARAKDTDVMATSRDTLQVELGLAWCAIHAGDPALASLRLREVARRVEELQAGAREAREKGQPVREEFLDLGQVYHTLAVAELEDGKLAEAEASFARALELQPNSPETHQNFGHLLARANRWEEAAREYETAARLRPGNPKDRLLLAQAWLELGRAKEAEALALPLLAELPGRSEVLLLLAVAALARESEVEALRRLDEALALDPRNALAWSHKARVLRRRGDARGALPAFRNAVELDPAGFEAHYELAGFLLEQGALAEARPYLVRAYVLAPLPHREVLRRNLAGMELEDEALLELERADEERGDLAHALTWCERRLALAPTNGAATLQRARLLRRSGRDDEAVAAFHARAEAARDDYEVWSELGAYLHALGRAAEARPVIEHALTLDFPPGFPADLSRRSKEQLRALLE